MDAQSISTRAETSPTRSQVNTIQHHFPACILVRQLRLFRLVKPFLKHPRLNPEICDAFAGSATARTMDGLSAAASVIGVIQIAGTVASLCSRYLKTAKNAKRDIERLQGELNSLLAVLTGAQSLLEGPKGTRLQTLRELRDGLTECSSQLSDLKAKLEKRRPEATEKILKLIGAHARWPFESSDVDDIIRNLNNCRDTISAALNIDQTYVTEPRLSYIADFVSTAYFFWAIWNKLTTRNGSRFWTGSHQYRTGNFTTLSRRNEPLIHANGCYVMRCSANGKTIRRR